MAAICLKVGSHPELSRIPRAIVGSVSVLSTYMPLYGLVWMFCMYFAYTSIRFDPAGQVLVFYREICLLAAILGSGSVGEKGIF